MKQLTLPDELVLGSAASRPATCLVAYTTSQLSERTNITLRYHLFSFLQAGEKVVTYPTATTRIAPGQFLLLPAGNCLMSEKLAGPDRPYHSTLLFFSPQALTAFFEKYPSLAGGAPPPGEEPFHVFLADEFLTAFTQSLHLLLAAPPEVRPDMQQLKLEELLLYVSQQHPAALAKLRAQAQAQQTAEKQRIQRLMASPLPADATVEDLAFLCHTSLSTFKRRFGQLYGLPPGKWLIRQRLSRAEQLLRQGTLRASDIYLQVGYETMSSFVHSFKQAYGLTPKKFQLQYASHLPSADPANEVAQRHAVGK